MSNDDLERSVADELYWDPKVDNGAIAVSAENGVVTLRGTVGSFRQKLEAKKAAERVYGVKGVDNQLQVRLLDDYSKEDADLRGSVLKALTLNTFVPSTIDANVTDSTVTLTGTVDWQYERDEAEWVRRQRARRDGRVRRDRARRPEPGRGRRQARDQGRVQARREARRRHALGLDLRRHRHARRHRQLLVGARRGDRRRLGCSGCHERRGQRPRRVLSWQANAPGGAGRHHVPRRQASCWPNHS